MKEILAFILGGVIVMVLVANYPVNQPYFGYLPSNVEPLPAGSKIYCWVCDEHIYTTQITLEVDSVCDATDFKPATKDIPQPINSTGVNAGRMDCPLCFEQFVKGDDAWSNKMKTDKGVWP